MDSVDWKQVDDDYQEYCNRCYQEGKKPADFGEWFMTPVDEEPKTA